MILAWVCLIILTMLDHSSLGELIKNRQKNRQRNPLNNQVTTMMDGEARAWRAANHLPFGCLNRQSGAKRGRRDARHPRALALLLGMALKMPCISVISWLCRRILVMPWQLCRCGRCLCHCWCRGAIYCSEVANLTWWFEDKREGLRLMFWMNGSAFCPLLVGVLNTYVEGEMYIRLMSIFNVVKV